MVLINYLDTHLDFSGLIPLKVEKICSDMFLHSTGLYYKTFYGRKLRIFVTSLSVCPWQAFQA